MRSLILAVLALTAASGFGQDYAIGPGDVVRVVVLGQPDMTGEFAVAADGSLNFPFVGRVPAAGGTAAQLERRLTDLLADGFLKQPRVSVQVKEFRSQRVFVTGEVQKPGPYGLRPDRSLVALLTDLGELTPNAGHEVVVVRPPKAADAAEPAPSPTPSATAPGDVPGARVFHVSLREIRSGNPDKDFRLEPGDTVYVPKAAQIYVTGNVAHPGAFRFEEGLTVYQALNQAGGVTDRGSAKGAKIVRIVEGKRQELKTKPGDLLQPEDTLLVPERFF